MTTKEKQKLRKKRKVRYAAKKDDKSKEVHTKDNRRDEGS